MNPKSSSPARILHILRHTSIWSAVTSNLASVKPTKLYCLPTKLHFLNLVRNFSLLIPPFFFSFASTAYLPKWNGKLHEIISHLKKKESPLQHWTQRRHRRNLSWWICTVSVRLGLQLAYWSRITTTRGVTTLCHRITYSRPPLIWVFPNGHLSRAHITHEPLALGAGKRFRNASITTFTVISQSFSRVNLCPSEPLI